MLYFAYGSNMFPPRLKARTPSVKFGSTGFVEKYKLTFDKRSVDRSGEPSGKCDMEATGDWADLVHGVLFSIAESETGDLDAREGLGDGYRKDVVQVVTPNGTSPALAYVATDKASGLLPYDWYKAFVVRGAELHELPPAYIDKLKAIRSRLDPNEKRRAINEAILSTPWPPEPSAGL